MIDDRTHGKRRRHRGGNALSEEMRSALVQMVQEVVCTFLRRELAVASDEVAERGRFSVERAILLAGHNIDVRLGLMLMYSSLFEFDCMRGGVGLMGKCAACASHGKSTKTGLGCDVERVETFPEEAGW